MDQLNVPADLAYLNLTQELSSFPDANLCYHECFVCGDRIELTAQVCSRFCMRALEQLQEMDGLDSLEAQVFTPTAATQTSDYESSTTTIQTFIRPGPTEAKLE
jgi:hypothetical protein